MKRRSSMCETCPYRAVDEAYRKETAGLPAEAWPCHSEDLYANDQETECRGHWEARRKFPNEPRPPAMDMAEVIL